MNFSHFGINIGAYPGLDKLGAIPYLRNHGFTAVCTDDLGEEEMCRLAEQFAAAGLIYDMVHAPVRNLNHIWLEGDTGEEVVKMLTDCIDHCSAAAAPLAVVHLSSGLKPPPVTDIGRARFDRIISYAAQKGITLAFENLRTVSNIAYIFEQYPDAAHVGFCWDCGHESCFTPGRNMMQLFGERLICVHLHDNFGRLGEKRDDRHLLPFDGSIDMHAVAEAIAASPFRGTMMLEVTAANAPYADMTPDEYFARAAESVRRLARLCEEKEKSPK